MWQKKESKLELAAAIVRQVMPTFDSQKNVIILCDSWYTKKNLACIVDEYPNQNLSEKYQTQPILLRMMFDSCFEYLTHRSELNFRKFDFSAQPYISGCHCTNHYI